MEPLSQSEDEVEIHFYLFSRILIRPKERKFKIVVYPNFSYMEILSGDYADL